LPASGGVARTAAAAAASVMAAVAPLTRKSRARAACREKLHRRRVG
jgi:hypothetical protein